jgi:hypothetical protein
MQFDICGRPVYVTSMLCRYIEGRLHFVLSRSGPREAAWDLYGPRHDPDWRKREIKSWVQLHHLELMKSCGRSVARSIAKSQGDGDLARHRTR